MRGELCSVLAELLVPPDDHFFDVLGDIVLPNDVSTPFTFPIVPSVTDDAVLRLGAKFFSIKYRAVVKFSLKPLLRNALSS